MYSRLSPWDLFSTTAAMFVSGFDGIKCQAALMRRTLIFADIFSVLMPPRDSDSDQLTSACTPPPSSPPFLSTATLLLYDPNGHHARSNAARCCFSPVSSSFSHFLLGFFRAPSPETQRLSCKRKSLSCSRYTSLRTAIHSKPPCHRVTRGF
jgi:hypothetical protein